MLKNYLITAIRNIYRNKTFTFLNVIGLATGLSVALLLFIYVQFEYSYENFHTNSKQIYRVYRNAHADQEARIGLAPGALMKNDFPEIKEVVRIAYLPEVKIEHKNEVFIEKKFIFADPEILGVFTFPLIQGDSKTALSEPNTVVITQDVAFKYFGSANAIGKIIGDKNPLKVTGILKDIPDNTHLRFSMLSSLETFKNWHNHKSWEWNGLNYTYLLLPSNYDPNVLESKLSFFEKKYGIENKYRFSFNYKLESLEKIHLYSRCFTVLPDISMKFNDIILYLFIILGSVILFISCINFINILTARSITRSKEVGVRKVLGASRVQLIIQFFLEFFIITFITLSIAMVVVELSLPLITSITGREIFIDYFSNYQYIFGALIIITLVTIGSGIYPSLMLSGFNPTKALKNSLKTPKGAFNRKLMTTFQFTTSVLLVLITYFIIKISNSYYEGNLGFNQNNLVVIKLSDQKIRKQYYNLKNELLKNPNIKGITASSNEPSVNGWDFFTIKTENQSEALINYISIDQDFLKTLEIKLTEGRNLNEEFNEDLKNGLLINQKTISQLGLEDPLGKKIELFNKDDEKLTLQKEGNVVGVINTYAYRPMYDKLQGVVFSIDSSKFNYAIIRIAEENTKQALDQIKNVWQSYFPNTPFHFTYLKDDIKNDIGIRFLKKAGNLFSLTSFISIAIAILGLIALILFNTQQKTKEIGLKKVFGAPTSKLVFSLSYETIKLVMLANIVSGGIIYWIMEVLIMPHTKQMDFNIGIFIIVMAASVMLTMLTIILIVMKTVRTNPVEALRYE